MTSARLPEDLDSLIRGAATTLPDDLSVACYTFPHYHRSALNDELYGPGWTEYVTTRGARPRFEGHHQPRTPLLGELDERDPATWTTYNRLLKAAGVDTLIWDWYWLDGEPVLHEALEEGYLRSQHQGRFAVMWTNAVWPIFIQTMHLDGTSSWPFVIESQDSPEETWRSLSYIVARYLHLPNYMRLPNGDPFLVIYDTARLETALTTSGVAELFSDLRAFARSCGHERIHIHASQGIVSQLAGFQTFPRLEEMGYDSFGIYNPLTVAGMERPAEDGNVLDYGVLAADTVSKVWPELAERSSLPFLPCVSPGWDNSPRFPQPDPTTRKQGGFIAVDETPAAFEAFLRAAIAFVNERQTTPPVVLIGCLNEFTEGAYLLPDTRIGYGMLEAVSSALGRDGKPWLAVAGKDAEPPMWPGPLPEEV
ncbi:MAG TPA: glycoside hydrolase family 99-like domain-containing protein [Gaiellaceae bacterium]|nr:glycoside hydrolase family 99-like domain-containing protein [Gaiellaceae bacterium]